MSQPTLLRRDWFLIAAAFVTATVIHWLLYWRGFYGVSWDDAGRTLDAYEWLQDPHILRVAPWLPLHRVVVGSALALHPDLFVTPRVVTFLFGLGTLAMLTWLAAELFRDRRITTTTALFGAIFMPRVVLFLAPLSCGLFSGIIVAAMAALARWLRTSTRASLVLAALAFALSTTVRYEGWGFAAAFGMVVVASRGTNSHRIGWNDIVLVGAIVSVFPLLWIALSAADSAGPFASLGKNGTAFADWHAVWRKNPLTEFLVINGLTLNVIGLWSAAWQARCEVRFRKFLFVAVVPLLVASAALLAGKRAQSGPSWRMIVVWSLLLAPFTMQALSRLRQRTRNIGRPLAAGAFVGLSLLSVVAIYRMEQQSRWAIPPQTRTIGRDLHRWLVTSPPGTHALIETSIFSYLNLLVSSQRPDLFIRNSAPEVDNDPSAIVSAERPLPFAELQRRNIRFLVFRTRALRDLLDRQPELRLLTDYGEWVVYEVG